MKIAHLTIVPVLLSWLVASLATGSPAQTTPRSRYSSARRSPVARPAAPPAIDTDPHFQRVLANSEVRVFRLTLGPNESTTSTAHPRDYLVASLGESDVQAVGDINNVSLRMNDGETQIVTGGWSHKLVNRSAQPANLVVLEVVHGIAPQQGVCGLSGRSCGQVRFGNTRDGRYSQATLFETATVRLLRAELGPGGVLPSHTDPLGHLVVTLTQARLTDGTAEASDEPAGCAWWMADGLGSLKNSGSQDTRMLILEVK